MVAAAVPEAAREAGLSVLALTDHDTLDGVAAARATGERIGVRVIAGVELSATRGEREVHLLGLLLHDVTALETRLAEFRAGRVARAERMIAQLNALGLEITMDDVLRQAAGGAVGRPHVARALVGRGHVAEQREAFDRYLGYGRPGYAPKPKLPMPEAIRMVHEAGGIAVLAHPGRDGNRSWVEPLVAMGLDGIEVWHPSHSPDDVTRIGRLADALGLVASGGSDWHGAPDGTRALGVMRVPYDVLARQEERAAVRRAAGRD